MSKLQSPCPWFRHSHRHHQSPPQPQPYQVRKGRRMGRIQMTMTFHLSLNMFPLSTKPKVLLGSSFRWSLGTRQTTLKIRRMSWIAVKVTSRSREKDLRYLLLHLNQRCHVKLKALVYHPVIQPFQEEEGAVVVRAGVEPAEAARGSTSRCPPAPPPLPQRPRCPLVRGRGACGAKCADLARPRTAAPVTTVSTNRSLVAQTRRSKLALTVNV